MDNREFAKFMIEVAHELLENDSHNYDAILLAIEGAKRAVLKERAKPTISWDD